MKMISTTEKKLLPESDIKCKALHGTEWIAMKTIL